MKEFLIISVVLGLVPAFIARSQGRSFVGWWIYGTLLLIVAIVHSVVLKPKPENLRAEQHRARIGWTERQRKEWWRDLRSHNLGPALLVFSPFVVWSVASSTIDEVLLRTFATFGITF